MRVCVCVYVCVCVCVYIYPACGYCIAARPIDRCRSSSPASTQTPRVASHHITSHRITSHRIASHHITSESHGSAYVRTHPRSTTTTRQLLSPPPCAIAGSSANVWTREQLRRKEHCWANERASATSTSASQGCLDFDKKAALVQFVSCPSLHCSDWGGTHACCPIPSGHGMDRTPTHDWRRRRGF